MQLPRIWSLYLITCLCLGFYRVSQGRVLSV
nr:MAG TPA: hypothetical protein [Caudoviricetes sp.]